MMNDHDYMALAYQQALVAYDEQEVPIGAVMVNAQGLVVAAGYNRVEQNQSQLQHAELLVIEASARQLSSWRLQGYTLYVTLQPCMMCLGALYLSRVSRVVYAIPSEKYGFGPDQAAFGIYKNLNILSECLDYEPAKLLMKQFFEKKRNDCAAKNRIGKS